MLANLEMLSGTAIGRRALAPDPSQLPPLQPPRTSSTSTPSTSSSSSSTVSNTGGAAKGTGSGDELRKKVVTKEMLKDQQGRGAEAVEEAVQEVEKSAMEGLRETGEASSRAPMDI